MSSPLPPSAPGCVYLVGAGPGNPGLLTLRGATCLARADLVLYDYLANPRLLEHVRPGVECVLFPQGNDRRTLQAEAAARMIAAVRAGRNVVRLKGGDPAIFARLSEELEALSAADVPFEVVPGVTAAAAAAAYAGLSLTDRDSASAVAFCTGQEGDKPAAALDFAALARFPGTLVFYMGVTGVARWASALLAAGKPASTPVLVVERSSWPHQRSVRCVLGAAAETIAAQGVQPPAVVIVGDSAAADPALAWSDRRPLAGRTVLVTRPGRQSHDLRDRLEELGARALVQPAVEIRAAPDPRPLDSALERLSDFAWVVFSSANGVQFCLERLFARGDDARRFGSARIAAIGPGTAEALRQFHLRADLLPAEYRAESLADALVERRGSLAAAERVLLVRASRGREVLAERLAAAGFEVEQVVAYESLDAAAPDPAVRSALQAGEITWVTVTSSAIARSLVRSCGQDLRRAALASISPITSATLREAGFEPAAEASVYTVPGLVAALLAAEADRAAAKSP